MANHSRWDDVKKTRPEPSADVHNDVEQDFALRQLIYDLRTQAGLSQRAVAQRMGTTQSVISRLEEGGGAKNRLDTLARVATALDRHLVVSFPEKVPAHLKEAFQSPLLGMPGDRPTATGSMGTCRP
ncbi:MAG TPA: helix-turn-helix transcriptional regulator [Acidimicrobiales bacterium]|nr:helix-turn-helix transcriptional regulator [Acidimicrobiales bacterium]